MMELPPELKDMLFGYLPNRTLLPYFLATTACNTYLPRHLQYRRYRYMCPTRTHNYLKDRHKFIEHHIRNGSESCVDVGEQDVHFHHFMYFDEESFDMFLRESEIIGGLIYIKYIDKTKVCHFISFLFKSDRIIFNSKGLRNAFLDIITTFGPDKQLESLFIDYGFEIDSVKKIDPMVASHYLRNGEPMYYADLLIKFLEWEVPLSFADRFIPYDYICILHHSDRVGSRLANMQTQNPSFYDEEGCPCLSMDLHNRILDQFIALFRKYGNGPPYNLYQNWIMADYREIMDMQPKMKIDHLVRLYHKALKLYHRYDEILH